MIEHGYDSCSVLVDSESNFRGLVMASEVRCNAVDYETGSSFTAQSLTLESTQDCRRKAQELEDALSRAASRLAKLDALEADVKAWTAELKDLQEERHESDANLAKERSRIQHLVRLEKDVWWCRFCCTMRMQKLSRKGNKRSPTTSSSGSVRYFLCLHHWVWRVSTCDHVHAGNKPYRQ